MKKSFMNYIKDTNAEIGRYPEKTTNIEPVVITPVPKKVNVIKPAPEIFTEDIKIVPKIEEVVVEEPVFEEEEIVEESIQEAVEDEYQPDEIITEQETNNNAMLAETLYEMKNFLAEQYVNQNMMGKLLTEMLDTIKTQNLLIQQKFDQLDEAAVNTARMLKETSDKLEEIVVRELTIPAPVVNVALSEQKRIVKTVDRDGNGLITQITEEIQQSVSKDK